jgi:hypothetical protein
MADNDEGDETWSTIEENLWSMRLAKVTKLDVLSDKLLFGLWPPFVLAILTFVVSRTVLLVFGLKELTVSWLLEFGLIISGLLLVVVGAFVLSKGYARAIDELPQNPPEHNIPSSRMRYTDRILNKIDSVVLKISWKGKDDELWKDYSTPPRLRWVLYAGGLTLHITYLFVLGNYSYVISTQGFIAVS